MDKERKNVRKNKFFNKKYLTKFLKMGSIPCWVQFNGFQIGASFNPQQFSILRGWGNLFDLQ